MVEFLSYEGSFTAASGPAAGMTSVAIPVEETSTTPVGFSLQRTGSGCEASDFTWTGPLAASSGALNAGQAYDATLCGDDPPPPPVVITKIYDIQGAGHISPYVGQQVTTEAVVTAVAFDGYYVQDPLGDSDDATSDGIFVFVGAAGAKPAIGDLVRLQDIVQEFIPGGAGTGNLSITELTAPAITVLSNGNTLPSPVVVGTGGRIPPNVLVISGAETPVNLQTVPGVFNPAVDGIDFYQSLEGMRVTVQDAVAVSALRRFGNFTSELFTLSDNGANVAPATARTARGGINLQSHPDNLGDQNPERVQIQFDASPQFAGTLYPGTAPLIKVGDRLGDLTGMMSYDFGNFEVRLTEAASVVTPSAIGPETTALAGDKHKLTIATYNVLNLSPDASDDAQQATLAEHIVDHLSPDIIALQEVQDNSGETDDGVTAASLTLILLANAVAAAGGPAYQFIDVPPANNSSGGVPGGNIRSAYLYNPERVQVREISSLTSTALALLGVSDPDAFAGSRAPLLVEFQFQGQKVTIINNHLSSPSGSSRIFGGPQPFSQNAEATRGKRQTKSSRHCTSSPPNCADRVHPDGRPGIPARWNPSDRNGRSTGRLARGRHLRSMRSSVRNRDPCLVHALASVLWPRIRERHPGPVQRRSVG